MDSRSKDPSPVLCLVLSIPISPSQRLAKPVQREDLNGRRWLGLISHPGTGRCEAGLDDTDDRVTQQVLQLPAPFSA